MGTIKDRNDKDLPEAEEIKTRWREYTKVPYKKGLNDPYNHDGLVTHLETHILECKEGLKKHYYYQKLVEHCTQKTLKTLSENYLN